MSGDGCNVALLNEDGCVILKSGLPNDPTQKEYLLMSVLMGILHNIIGSLVSDLPVCSIVSSHI